MHQKLIIFIFLIHTFVTTIFPMASSIIGLPTARLVCRRSLHIIFQNQKGESISVPCLVRNFLFGSKEPENSVVTLATKKIEGPVSVNPNIHLPVRKLKDLKGFNALVGKIPEQVKECSEMLTSFKEYEEMGAHIPKGLLMVGPPGTGKTSIAKAIAQEANVGYYFTEATQFNSRWYGESEQNIRNVFEKCRDKVKESNKPVILFIDEIDAIGSRTATSTSGGADKRALSELLNQMDGYAPAESLFATDVFVMGATNSADLLDPALKRPGRFDKIIEVPLPDIESLQALLTHYLSFTKYDMESISPEFIEETAVNIVGASPADIKYIINECAILAVRSKSPAINTSHIKAVFSRLQERNKNATQGLK